MLAESVQSTQLPKKEEVAVLRGMLKSAEARPEKLHVEDLAALEQLSEETILEEITQRYKNGNTYTFVGDVLISLNPNETIPEYVRGVSKGLRNDLKFNDTLNNI